MGFTGVYASLRRKAEITGPGSCIPTQHSKGEKGHGEAQMWALQAVLRILFLQCTMHAGRGRSGGNRRSVPSAFGPWVALGTLFCPADQTPAMVLLPRHRETWIKPQSHCAGDQEERAFTTCRCPQLLPPGLQGGSWTVHGPHCAQCSGPGRPWAAGCTVGWRGGCTSSRLLRPAAPEWGLGVPGAGVGAH